MIRHLFWVGRQMRMTGRLQETIWLGRWATVGCWELFFSVIVRWRDGRCRRFGCDFRGGSRRCSRWGYGCGVVGLSGSVGGMLFEEFVEGGFEVRFKFLTLSSEIAIAELRSGVLVADPLFVRVRSGVW